MSVVTSEIEKLARILVEAAFPISTNGSIEISSSGLERGENFVGLIYNVTFTDENGTLHLVLKVAPQNAYFRETFGIRELYKREIFTYKEILREFSEIQRDKILERNFQAFAKLYASSIEYMQEALIMENVKIKGFRLINHRISVDYPHASLVMREIAKFHALSYATRDQKPNIFDSWKDQCHECFLSSNIKTSALKALSNLTNAILTSYPPQQNEEERKALQEFANILPATYSSCISRDDRKYAVIVHGDLQIRNLLFKYKNQDGSECPTELCILDWQIMHLASPAVEILFFIFISSDKEMRGLHYSTLIEEYYQSLSLFLRELGSDPESLLPFPILLEHLKKYSGLALLLTIWISSSIMKEGDDVPDFSNCDGEDALVAMVSIIPKRGYLQRMRDVVSDMMKCGYPFYMLADQSHS